ncbi:hypothetical protein [Deinococcus aquaticus]|uniref:Uncharacterized protein n=1 Tax=Deinococcus aquaticus TaxID=328692 RepID=A0ABY7UXC2_9DEIO|nr:hypothetical protein [Deinococcus aquaticus]WDA57542.1 hypothetical protein M8445_09220 [Deinococcus aquaticus]
MTRKEYLIRCALISVRRRLGRVVLTGLLLGAAAAALGLPLALAALGLLLGMAGTAAWIAVQSSQRHADDVLPASVTRGDTVQPS